MLVKQTIRQFENAGPYWEIDDRYNWVIDDLEKALGNEDVVNLLPRHFKVLLRTLGLRVSTQDSRQDRGITLSGVQKAILIFLRWLSLEIGIRQINTDPEANYSDADDAPFEPRELEVLWNAARNFQCEGYIQFLGSALLAILLRTGMSYKDIVSLQMCHLVKEPFGLRHPRTDAYYDLRGPEGKHVIRYWMERGLLADSEPLFVNGDDKPFGERQIRALLARLSTETGVYARVVRFRRTFVHNQLDAGRKEYDLRQMLEYPLFNELIYELQAAQRLILDDFRKAGPVDNWGV